MCDAESDSWPDSTPPEVPADIRVELRGGVAVLRVVGDLDLSTHEAFTDWLVTRSVSPGSVFPDVPHLPGAVGRVETHVSLQRRTRSAASVTVFG